MYTLEKLVFNLLLFSLLRYYIPIIGNPNSTKKYEGKNCRLKVPPEMTIINVLMIVFLYMRGKEREGALCVCIYGISSIYFLLKDMILCHFLITSFEVFGLCTQIVSSLMEGIT